MTWLVDWVVALVGFVAVVTFADGFWAGVCVVVVGVVRDVTRTLLWGWLDMPVDVSFTD